MCLFGAARITHRAQRIVSIASQWHMRMVSAGLHHGKPDQSIAVSTSAGDIDTVALVVPTGSACEYKSRQALGNKMKQLLFSEDKI
jgi:hypothetical protein